MALPEGALDKEKGSGFPVLDLSTLETVKGSEPFPPPPEGLKPPLRLKVDLRYQLP